jgi:hypothetical protein
VAPFLLGLLQFSDFPLQDGHMLAQLARDTLANRDLQHDNPHAVVHGSLRRGE